MIYIWAFEAAREPESGRGGYYAVSDCISSMQSLLGQDCME